MTDKRGVDGDGNPVTPGEWFTCWLCKGRFVADLSDDEVRAEAEADWGKGIFNREPMGVICDACYRRVMPQGRPS